MTKSSTESPNPASSRRTHRFRALIVRSPMTSLRADLQKRRRSPPQQEEPDCRSVCTGMTSMKNQGYVLVTFAILLSVLLGFSALAVDLGIMNSARTSAQRAADAAALAGAFTFIVDPTSPQPATATQHAQQAATANNILGSAIQLGDVTVAVDNGN